MDDLSFSGSPGSGKTINETSYYRSKISYGENEFEHAGFRLTAVEGMNIFRYLKSFDLTSEQQLLILSTSNHYYYDENDLKNIRTIVNLKRLNLIADVDTFFNTICSVLPPGVNFVGCFYDSNTWFGSGLLSGLSSRLNNLLDSRTDNNMNRNDVTELLEKYGFRAIDMTEMNGMTYFYARNIRQDIKTGA